RIDGVEVEVHALFGAGAGTGLADDDLVGATHAQAARGVAAALVGGGAADRAGFDVADDDFGTRDRLSAVVDDEAADAGGRALREGGRGGKRGDQAERKFRHTEVIATGHVRTLGCRKNGTRPDGGTHGIRFWIPTHAATAGAAAVNNR